jgi:acetylornithine deacetylase/succinyl-diaminopimelate desuccinylase-like protein
VQRLEIIYAFWSSMDIDRVFDYIDPEAIGQDTLDFVKVKSETGQEQEGSIFFADLLRREGFEVSLDEVEPGRCNVYALMKSRSPQAVRRPSLMLNGHVDTIPVGRSASPAMEGDWVIGRGTEDMKGGLVAMAHAASALRKAGLELAGDLWITGVIGHESPAGKKEGPKRLIQHLRSGKMRADAIIIAEGPCAIWAASLGSAIFTVTITSDLGPIHTIKVPYAANPARWLGELLVEFEAFERKVSTVAPHPLCGRERLNVGIVSAGDYCNRLPTTCTVTGTWRWQPGKTHQGVRADLDAICGSLARRSGLKVEASFEAAREPFETPRSHPVIQALEQAGRMTAGKPPEVIGMGLVGDANFYANDAGVPTVYYGPGHQTAHSDNERVSVAQLTHCAKVYAAAATIYCADAE